MNYHSLVLTVNDRLLTNRKAIFFFDYTTFIFLWGSSLMLRDCSTLLHIPFHTFYIIKHKYDRSK